MIPSNAVFLIVEDNKIDQMITSKLLKNELDAIDISIANNGKEALHWIIKHHSKLCNKGLIIVLDLKMPEMNGFEFLHEFDKHNSSFKIETHIFMLSSTLNDSEIKQIEAHPLVARFFNKPFPVKQFIKYLTPN